MARVRVAGEVFSGYNKPKRDVQSGKEFSVAAKEGDKVKPNLLKLKKLK